MRQNQLSNYRGPFQSKNTFPAKCLCHEQTNYQIYIAGCFTGGGGMVPKAAGKILKVNILYGQHESKPNWMSEKSGSNVQIFL